MNKEGIPEGIAFPEIADELLKMRKEDQDMRHSGEWNDSVDERNTERLKEIIQEIGWPTISKVGEIASDAAWLLVQHADKDVAFQKEVLSLMEEAPVGEVKSANIAYLTDRVRVSTGQPQLYGTQFRTGDNGEPTLVNNIEDPENLDDRRRLMGLEPFAEYEKLIRENN